MRTKDIAVRKAKAYAVEFFAADGVTSIPPQQMQDSGNGLDDEPLSRREANEDVPGEERTL